MQDDNAFIFLPSLHQFFPVMAQVPVAPLDPDVQAAINPAPAQQEPQLIAQQAALLAAQLEAQPAAQPPAQPQPQDQLVQPESVRTVQIIYTFCNISSNLSLVQS